VQLLASSALLTTSMPLYQPPKVPLLRSSGLQVRDDMVFLRGEKKVQSGKSQRPVFTG